jgi:hypothetical protein
MLVRTNATTSTLTLSWQGWFPNATNYRFRYGYVIGDATGMAYNLSPYYIVNGTEVTIGVHPYDEYQLLSNTVYRFTLQALNASGGVIGEIINNFATMPIVPANVRFIPSSILKNVFGITWDPVGGHDGVRFYYQVSTSEDFSNTEWLQLYWTTGNVRDVRNITDCTPNTKYFFRVKVENSEFVSEASPPSWVITSPENIQNIQTENLTSTTATITWDVPEGEPVTYVYMYTTEESFSAHNLRYVEEMSVAPPTVTLTSLSPFTSYMFIVVAVNDTARSEQFETIQFLTQRAGPGVPRNLRIAQQTYMSIKYAWNAPLENLMEPLIYEYQIVAANENFSDIEWSYAGVQTFSIVIYYLLPNTLYYFRVRAVNMQWYLPGNPTNPISGTTIFQLSWEPPRTPINPYSPLLYPYLTQIPRNPPRVYPLFLRAPRTVARSRATALRRFPSYTVSTILNK